MTGTIAHPEQLSATEAVAAIRDGRLSAEGLTAACLERIAARDATVHAWAHLDRDHALAQARALDRAGPSGLLHGLPVGVKDIIDTADMPTAYGSPIYAGNRPATDAACVTLCRDAGAVILGKTVTTEFANRHPGPTANPHDPAHTPGGSSSGSAAAVADHQATLAFGTQTAGSVIRPAAYCGVVGFKPTYGEISRVGVKLQSGTLDTIGLMARSLDDIALMRAAVLAIPLVPLRADPGAPRIGFCRTLNWEGAEPESRALLERVAAGLARQGARVADVALDAAFDNILRQHRRIMAFEATRNYAYEKTRHRDKLSRALLDGVIAEGDACTLADYAAAIEAGERLRTHLDDLFGGFDVLLTLSAPGTAPAGLTGTGDARCNAIWTLAHTPCVTLPAGKGANGLPLGIQLVGARDADHRLLEAARWIQARIG